MERGSFRRKDATYILATGRGGFRKHLSYLAVLPQVLVDNIMERLLKRFPDKIDVIEVWHNGKLAELLRVNL